MHENATLRITRAKVSKVFFLIVKSLKMQRGEGVEVDVIVVVVVVMVLGNAVSLPIPGGRPPLQKSKQHRFIETDRVPTQFACPSFTDTFPGFFFS